MKAILLKIHISSADRTSTSVAGHAHVARLIFVFFLILAAVLEVFLAENTIQLAALQSFLDLDNTKERGQNSIATARFR